jgi:hypothetical protein
MILFGACLGAFKGNHLQSGSKEDPVIIAFVPFLAGFQIGFVDHLSIICVPFFLLS